jgi:hypothetical protein
MTGTKVAIAMHGDGGSGSFERSHSIPEVGIWILELECRVLVVGDDGKNWRYSAARNNRQEPLPSVAQHGRTKVIEADKVLDWVRGHLCGPHLSPVRESTANRRHEMRSETGGRNWASRAERFLDRGCGGNERIDLGEFEKLNDVRVRPDDDDAHSLVPATNEVADERSQGRGVHLRDFGDIEDMQRGCLCAGGRLEVEDVSERYLLHRAVHVARVKWPGYAVDQSAGGLTFNSFNRE